MSNSHKQELFLKGPVQLVMDRFTCSIRHFQRYKRCTQLLKVNYQGLKFSKILIAVHSHLPGYKFHQLQQVGKLQNSEKFKVQSHLKLTQTELKTNTKAGLS